MTRQSVEWLKAQPPLGMLKRWPISLQARRLKSRSGRPRAGFTQERRLRLSNARKTACPRGHAYDMTTSKGGRACRQCTRAQNATNQKLRRLRVKQRRLETSCHG